MLSDDAIIRAIAEDRGWERTSTGWIRKPNEWCFDPPYLTDHNSAHELIEVLRGEGWYLSVHFRPGEWISVVATLRSADAGNNEREIYVKSPTFCRAAAEAFLRVWGKWKE